MAAESAALAAVQEPSGELGRRLAGKYMMFQLAGETYGLEILKVREIVGHLEITRVPRSQAVVRGVVNLRGKVIPVVDLRLKFGMPTAVATDQTVTILVQCHVADRLLTMGLLVDQVLEVLLMEARNVEALPYLGGASANDSFILGVGKTPERVVFLLDIGKVISEQEAQALCGAAA